MKTNVITFLAMTLCVLMSKAQTPFSGFNTDEEFKGTFWVDPTFEDTGFQFGAGIRKEVEFGWFGVEASAYPSLKIPYVDVVGQGGIIYNVNQRFDVLGGIRLGGLYREKVFPMAGAILIFEYEISPRYLKGLFFSVRLWLDWREDQKNQFYGDSDVHTYLVFSNPLTQENGAAGFTFSF